MNIQSIVPGPVELRKYLEEIMHDNHGFAEEIRSYVMQNYFSDFDSVYDIDMSILSEQNVLETLEKFDQIPQELFFIADKDGNKLTDRYDLTNLIEMQYNEQGGLAIFQSFNLQIYYLYNESGEELWGPSNKLSLGLNLTVEANKLENDDWSEVIYFCYRNKNLLCISFNIINDKSKFFPYSKEWNYLLQKFKDSERDNEDYVISVVKDYPISILYGSERLRNDKHFIKKLLTKPDCYSNVFPYLTIGLKEDPEIFSLVGITENTFEETVFDIDEYSKMKNEKLLWEILKENVSLFQYFPEAMKTRRKNVLSAIKMHGVLLEFVDHIYRSDKEVVLSAVSENGLSLQYASNQLRNDIEIVIAAITNNVDAMHYVDENLKNDKEIFDKFLSLLNERNLPF